MEDVQPHGESVNRAERRTTSRDSSFPVELPADRGLFLPNRQFAAYTHHLLQKAQTARDVVHSSAKLETMSLADSAVSDAPTIFTDAYSNASDETLRLNLSENMTLTENGAPAYISTNSRLLDLFTELEKTVSGERLEELLEPAWSEDALSTLRIIWQARSIHVGKGEQDSFYRCIGWLYHNHPKTLLANLPALVRRIVAKKKTEEEGDELLIVEEDGGDDDEELATTLPELRYGVSHGYWKDLLNLVVLASSLQLHVRADPKPVLHAPNPQRPVSQNKLARRRHRQMKRFAADVNRNVRKDGEGSPLLLVPPGEKHAEEAKKHAALLERYQDVSYRLLHLTVARLFAAQLRKDKALLDDTDHKARGNISLAGKWAPSLEGFHDRKSLMASTIAEALFPVDSLETAPVPRAGESMRTAYLRTVRERYRAEYLTPLRQYLRIVETPISRDAVHTIDYSTVPSVAMQKYKGLFMQKDFSRFAEHVQAVKRGTTKATMSGAVLQPATLVAEARRIGVHHAVQTYVLSTGRDAKRAFAEKQCELELDTLDEQWKTLVARVRGAGTLASVMAVADVSGSMSMPQFADRTTPLDTAVGMALLIAEVAPAPFGGQVITFSSTPELVQVGGPADPRPFAAKVDAILRSTWSMTTDFAAVFMRLLLPLAVQHSVAPAAMVSTLVVLSDMQFDEVEHVERRPSKKPSPSTIVGNAVRRWSPSADRAVLAPPTAAQLRGDAAEVAAAAAPYAGQALRTVHEAVAAAWAAHGYELPKLAFWNLRANAGARPVAGSTPGTMLVSGYSQGLLRGLMEHGGFGGEVVEDDAEEADAVAITVRDGDGDGTVTVTAEPPTKTRRVDPTAGLRRVLGHPAYRGLRVVD